MSVSQTAKMPFNALLHREALIWRLVELGRGAFENFQKDNLACSILLTRAAVETSAALWYMCTKVDAAVQSGVLADIGDYLMRLAMGSRTDPAMPQAISVLTFVDRVDKDVEGFRHQYDVLSEFSHPNWAGTALLYTKSDPPNLWTDFGANIRANESTKRIGVLNLSAALMCFERSYSRMSDLMPAFVALCESQLKIGEADDTPNPWPGDGRKS